LAPPDIWQPVAKRGQPAKLQQSHSVGRKRFLSSSFSFFQDTKKRFVLFDLDVLP
jgi:hypothetical protein